MTFNAYFAPHAKINSKWILKPKGKTENHPTLRRQFCVIQGFLGYNTDILGHGSKTVLGFKQFDMPHDSPSHASTQVFLETSVLVAKPGNNSSILQQVNE